MTVKELMSLMQSDESKIHAIGITKSGKVDLYHGEIRKLRKILMINEIIEQKNWGGLDPEKCFILRDLQSLDSGENGEIKVTIQMPDSYTHTDKDGNPLDSSL
jgi:hypothetical protein